MNEEKFTGKAEGYAQYRPAYPKEFIDYLHGEIGFCAESVIADIGAGTGIFSMLLAARGSAVICVEPNDDMLAVAKEKLSDFAKCSFFKASAEDTRLEDHTVDFITVAQAFHWFDRPRFQKECKRILKDGGRVVLVWNVRDPSTALVRENHQVNARYCPAFHGFTAGMNLSETQDFLDFFDGFCICRTFHDEWLFDEESFIGRNLSSSYALTQCDAEFSAYQEALCRVFRKYSENGVLRMPSITYSYVGRV